MKCVIYAKYQDKLQHLVANVLAIDANGTTKRDGMIWISLMLEIRHTHIQKMEIHATETQAKFLFSRHLAQHEYIYIYIA